MEKKKVSKKALKTLLNDSLRDAIGRLELPTPTKKIKKIVSKTSKVLAAEFADQLKKEQKKIKKAEKSLTYVEDVLTGNRPANGKKGKLKGIQTA